MNYASNYHDDEFITRTELAKVFLKMSVRTFEMRRKELVANGLPKPDIRFRSQRFHVGKIRKWISGNSGSSTSFTKPNTNSKSESDELISSFD